MGFILICLTWTYHRVFMVQEEAIWLVENNSTIYTSLLSPNCPNFFHFRLSNFLNAAIKFAFTWQFLLASHCVYGGEKNVGSIVDHFHSIPP